MKNIIIIELGGGGGGCGEGSGGRDGGNCRRPGLAWKGALSRTAARATNAHASAIATRLVVGYLSIYLGSSPKSTLI